MFPGPPLLWHAVPDLMPCPVPSCNRPCAAFAGLFVQWLVFPDSVKDTAAEAARRRAQAEAAAGPQLPKVSVTAKPDELRRAFAQAERLGQKEGKAAAAAIEAGGLSSASAGSTDGGEVVSSQAVGAGKD